MSYTSGGSGASANGHQSRRIEATTSSNLVEVKSKFDAEFRRVSLRRDRLPGFDEFRQLVSRLHGLHDVPFTMCYTDGNDDLLPITNDDNFRHAVTCARPLLRLLIQRKGESWEEKFGYGTERRKGFLGAIVASAKPTRKYDISQPEEFRLVSAVIDVDVVPDTYRRVRLCKHGSSRPLGFYIRDGVSVRLTAAGVVKVPGVFISRLVKDGLAESTGLLSVNDEVLEVNGIEVAGKTLDQVTDMMVANAANLIITVKPTNQRAAMARGALARQSGTSDWSEGNKTTNDSEDELDEIRDMSNSAAQLANKR